MSNGITAPAPPNPSVPVRPSRRRRRRGFLGGVPESSFNPLELRGIGEILRRLPALRRSTNQFERINRGQLNLFEPGGLFSSLLGQDPNANLIPPNLQAALGQDPRENLLPPNLQAILGQDVLSPQLRSRLAVDPRQNLLPQSLRGILSEDPRANLQLPEGLREAVLNPLTREFQEIVLPSLGSDQRISQGVSGGTRGSGRALQAGERFLEQARDQLFQQNLQQLEAQFGRNLATRQQVLGQQQQQFGQNIGDIQQILAQQEGALGLRSQLSNEQQQAFGRNLANIQQILQQQQGQFERNIGTRSSLLGQLGQAEQNIPTIQELLLRPGQIQAGLGQQIFQRPQDLLNEYARIVFGSGIPTGNTSIGTQVGGPQIPGVSRPASAIGGTLGGAGAGAGIGSILAGATAGSVLPGWGTAIGALLGLLGGLL